MKKLKIMAALLLILYLVMYLTGGPELMVRWTFVLPTALLLPDLIRTVGLRIGIILNLIPAAVGLGLLVRAGAGTASLIYNLLIYMAVTLIMLFLSRMFNKYG